MNIGEAARRSSVSAKMIRYYENVGLMPAAGRKANGYRDYDETDVAALQFLRRSRDLGFSMDETRDLLTLWRDRSRPSREVKQLVERHVADLTRRIQEMKAMRDALAQLSKACAGDDRPDCPILADLAKGQRKARATHS
jgi:MerR family transcriptional regulator, copper efflux regulator